MVHTIVSQVEETAGWLGVEQLSEPVLRAMREVPRHEFVPDWLQSHAYDDAALPIAHGQTISQPYIVAISTELAAVGPDDVVLDVGTGCGYQAAVLARVVRRVYSIELIPELAEEAAARLARLGIDNVEVHVGDGWEGWSEHAPYDGIVVAAAASSLPTALVDQLADGGHMVIPVVHDLLVVTRDESGATRTRKTIPVAFVPLRRGARSPK